MTDKRQPLWRRPHQTEQRWPVALAIAVAIGLQLLTPPNLAFQPNWLLPGLEAALLVGLVVANPYRINPESTRIRAGSLALVLVATLAVVWSTGRLIVLLTSGADPVGAAEVLLSGTLVWLTNVLVFALWFWELDRGGPAARATARRSQPDLLFPQMTVPDLVHEQWRPVVVDYLYTALTNSTAFSPTDTMPLARWAKGAMALQSLVSLLVVVLVIARAVNSIH